MSKVRAGVWTHQSIGDAIVGKRKDWDGCKWVGRGRGVSRRLDPGHAPVPVPTYKAEQACKLLWKPMKLA